MSHICLDRVSYTSDGCTTRVGLQDFLVAISSHLVVLVAIYLLPCIILLYISYENY